jgi:hypothetical protein
LPGNKAKESVDDTGSFAISGAIEE